MIRLAYNIALVLGIALAAPWLAARMARGRYRKIVKARLGLGSSWLPPKEASGGIWVHALSVGEVRSALPLLKSLQEAFPGLPVCLSAATAQGYEVAVRELEGSGVTVFVRPLDLPWAVRRLLDRLRPRLFCLVEGDIWPNWQWFMAKRGTPCMLVNNRVSPRTHRGYRRLGPLARELFMGFDRVLAQTRVDYERLLDIGVPRGRLLAGGNLKFDSAPPELSPDQRREFGRELGLEGRKVLVAGSTHQGEDQPLLEAFVSLLPDYPDLALVLAPREVNQGPALARLAERQGLKAACLSQGTPSQGCQVVILDMLGKLANAYALAEAAFVGGSFVPVGGHNLLEPAAQGVPVLFGPITHNFKEMAEQLEAAGGGRRLADPSQLAGAFRELLDDPQKAAQMGDAARQFCLAHRGAVAKAVSQAHELLKDGSHA